MFDHERNWIIIRCSPPHLVTHHCLAEQCPAYPSPSPSAPCFSSPASQDLINLTIKTVEMIHKNTFLQSLSLLLPSIFLFNYLLCYLVLVLLNSLAQRGHIRIELVNISLKLDLEINEIRILHLAWLWFSPRLGYHPPQLCLIHLYKSIKYKKVWL